MKLLLVRHAESEGNATGNYATEEADSLSAQGEKQAQSLVRELARWRFDTIVVSPLRRALQTVAPYLDATGRTAEIWPEIAEACWHEERVPPTASWSSKPATLPQHLAHLFAFRDGQAIRHAEPESFGAGLRRVHIALEKLQNDCGLSEQTILMVTHGHFIREILNLMQNTPQLLEFHHENCGMTLMSFDGTWKVVFLNRHTVTPTEHEPMIITNVFA